jgi:hypothetical protein
MTTVVVSNQIRQARCRKQISIVLSVLGALARFHVGASVKVKVNMGSQVGENPLHLTTRINFYALSTERGGFCRSDAYWLEVMI